MSTRPFVVLVVSLALTRGLLAADSPPGTAYVDYFGYTDCIELSNESTRVVLCHQGRRPRLGVLAQRNEYHPS